VAAASSGPRANAFRTGNYLASNKGYQSQTGKHKDASAISHQCSHAPPAFGARAKQNSSITKPTRAR